MNQNIHDIKNDELKNSIVLLKNEPQNAAYNEMMKHFLFTSSLIAVIDRRDDNKLAVPNVVLQISGNSETLFPVFTDYEAGSQINLFNDLNKEIVSFEEIIKFVLNNSNRFSGIVINSGTSSSVVFSNNILSKFLEDISASE